MKGFFRRFYLAVILIFLYAPILTLIVFSFNESKTMAKWGGFSLSGTASCLPTPQYWARYS
jgi:spermidine/putrescine transport system permease protein